MSCKKTLIICQSIHHKNTLKVAEVIADELGGVIKKPSEVDEGDLEDYDLIGFGSGIYNGRHHSSLFKLIDEIKPQKNKKTFIFSTATITYKKMHEALREELTAKGFKVVGEYMCKGFIDYGFTKYLFGGLNKKRPGKKDLRKAREFAAAIKPKLEEV